MASAITLDDFAAMLASEPTSGTKTRKLTLDRRANVRNIMDGTSDVLDVTDETSLPGKGGDTLTLGSVLAAYRREIKNLDAEKVVAVRELKVAGKVVIHKIAA